MRRGGPISTRPLTKNPARGSVIFSREPIYSQSVTPWCGGWPAYRHSKEDVASARCELRPAPQRSLAFIGPAPESRANKRSEEHTSELQSHLNLVCRLLLEKKKKKQNKIE